MEKDTFKLRPADEFIELIKLLKIKNIAESKSCYFNADFNRRFFSFNFSGFETLDYTPKCKIIKKSFDSTIIKFKCFQFKQWLQFHSL